MLLKSGAGLFLTTLLIGCPSPGPATCTYAGSQSAAISASIVATLPDGGFGLIPDGGQVQISSAPQGCCVIYAGVYANNLNPCALTLSAELLTLDGGSALSNLDQRQANFDAMEGALFGPSNIEASMPNIPACPDTLGTGILGGPSILQVTITDVAGKTAVVQQVVQPVCPPGNDFCTSVCSE